jgi:3-deoxy-manno-octulosonate cytidylyltransferase (CMP-KDO synthetase)
MKPIIIIPARLAATRLPNKPLADILGKPMIARVIERAKLANIGQILVAAGDKEILPAAFKEGAQAILTDPNLPSGSDRVLAALKEFDSQNEYDIIINLQGDMPTFDPKILIYALEIMQKCPQADIVTLVSPSNDEQEKQDPNVVKAIISFDETGEIGNCLYFTRANAPSGEGPIYRHIGLYIYRRAALEKFVNAKPSPLELREKLEQLRALEMGLKIYAGIYNDFPKGVDTQSHLELAREFYKQLGE